MKKIALIMDGWKRFFTYAWPAGVLERIRETNEDVNLYIFNSSGDWSRDEDYNIGEYNIYRLPDLNDFDGIIVDLNNIRYSEVREYVISSAKATGKPVISIANEIADFYYVGIDNYSAMQEIAAHLYEVHNCRRFWIFSLLVRWKSLNISALIQPLIASMAALSVGVPARDIE